MGDWEMRPTPQGWQQFTPYAHGRLGFPMTESILLKNITHPPDPIRSEWSEEEMVSLTASVKKHGVLQPPAVREILGKYQIIFGHRRIEAARRAGHQKIEAIVMEASDGESLSLALIENIHREDMIPGDKARALQRLMQEMNLKSATAVESAGIMPRKSASALLNLLEQPADVINMVGLDSGGRGIERRTKPLAMDHVQRASVAADYQDDVLRKAAREGLTAKQTHSVAKAVRVAADNQDDLRAKALITTYPFSNRIHDEERESRRYQPILHIPSVEHRDIIENGDEDDVDTFSVEFTDFDKLLSLISALRASFNTTKYATDRMAIAFDFEQRKRISEDFVNLGAEMVEYGNRINLVE